HGRAGQPAGRFKAAEPTTDDHDMRLHLPPWMLQPCRIVPHRPNVDYDFHFVGTAVGQRPEVLRLGSYEILRQLARGGMAELFLARTVGPEGFEKLVVLKKILPKFAENPKFVRLFLDEARLAAALDHPHIAHVYDLGKVDGNYFFTMEYIHGQDV